MRGVVVVVVVSTCIEVAAAALVVDAAGKYLVSMNDALRSSLLLTVVAA